MSPATFNMYMNSDDFCSEKDLSTVLQELEEVEYDLDEYYDTEE